MPFSILKEGNFELNEYYEELTSAYPQPDDSTLTPYYLKESNGNYYSIRPVLTAFLATPVYIFPVLLDINIDIETIRIMSRFGGAFITALSAGFFYLIADKLTKNRKFKYLLFIVYCFGTNSLSTSSQGLWQHGSSQLLLSLGLYLLLNRKVFGSALAFGFAVISRPTNLLTYLIFGLYILFQKTENRAEKMKNIAVYATGGIIPILLELLFNQIVFGNPDNPGYAEQMSGWRANWLEGIFGMWISPSKGILINSPVLIFIFYGVFVKFKEFMKTKEMNIYIPIILSAILYTIAMGKWYSWYGGYSWGYRMASDVLPFMVLLLIPALESFYNQNSVFRNLILTLTGISIFNHLFGLVFFDGIWHTVHDGKKPGWLWSISESEYIFDFKRILYKLGIGDNPIKIPTD